MGGKGGGGDGGCIVAVKVQLPGVSKGMFPRKILEKLDCLELYSAHRF